VKFICASLVAVLVVAGGSAIADTAPPTTPALQENASMPDATNAAAMKAAATLTTKVLAIGSWTAKAPPESRPAIMPSEASETMRLMLSGKIDQ
jgi:hypothetical protein